MVGPFARAVSCKRKAEWVEDGEEDDPQRGMITVRHDYHSGATRQYAQYLGYRLVLTKFAFFHPRFLEAYAALPQRVLDMVHRFMNCEDIVMSWIHFNTTQKTAIWLPYSSGTTLKATNAISGGRGHGSRREYVTSL
jgi:hypothetical protein